MKNTILITFCLSFLISTGYGQGTDNCDNISMGTNNLLIGPNLADNSTSVDGTIWYYYNIPDDGFLHDITITLTAGTLAAPLIYQYNDDDINLDNDYCNDVFNNVNNNTSAIFGLCPGTTFVIEVGDNTPNFGDFTIDLSDVQSIASATASLATAETSGNTNNDNIVCEGDDFMVVENSGTGNTWDWLAPSGATSSGSSSTYDVFGATIGVDDGTYFVTVTDLVGCTATSMIDVIINPVPTAIPTVIELSGTANDGVLCQGETFDLEENSGYPTVEWFDPFGVSQGTGSPLNILAADPSLHDGNWTVVVTDINGCTDDEIIPITINNTPVLNITETDASGTPDDGIICDGDDFTLNEDSGTATSWVWTSSVGATFDNSGGNPVLVSGAVDQEIITVTATDINGCTATANYTITVATIPTPNITESDMSGNVNDDGFICDGDDFTLNEDSGTADSWTWSSSVGATFDNANGNPVVISGAVDQEVITVISSDISSGCSAMISYTINVTPLPTAVPSVVETSGTPNDGVLCEGESFDLEENSGYPTVEWFDPLGGSQGTGTPFNIAAADPILHNGNWTVVVTDVNGCTEDEIITITINSNPILNITETDASGNPDDGIICDGDDFTLNEDSGNATSWVWSSSVGATFDNSAGNPVIVSGAIDQEIITVTATDINGCTASENYTITVAPLPVPNITETDASGNTNDDGIICDGDDFTLNEDSGTADTWIWSSSIGATFDNVNGNPVVISGAVDQEVITVIASDLASGCSAMTSYTITVNPMPISSAQILNNPICPSEDLELDETGGEATDWVWSSNGAATFTSTVAQNPMASGVVDGEIFTVTVTDANGCTSSSSVTAMVDPPAVNDDCSTALTLTLGANTTLNNDCATFDQAVGSCPTPVDEASVWYSYNLASATGSLSFTLTATGITNPAIAVYAACGGTVLGEDCSGALVEIDCPTPGTYFIQVSSEFTNTGTFDIDVNETASTVPNDLCTGAIDITPAMVCVFESVSGDNTDACPEDFTNCSANSNPVVWYSFNTSANTSSVDFDNFLGSEELIVSDACPPTTITCFSAPGNFVAAPSTTYYVGVHLGSNLEGALGFDIRLNEGVDNDDPCSGTIPSGGQSGEDNTCATADISFCGAQSENTLYYQYTMVADGDLEIRVTGLTGAAIAAFDMPPCGQTPIATDCSTGQLTIACLLAGETYYFAVGSAALDAGTFDIGFVEMSSGSGPANDMCSNAIDITPTVNCAFEPVSGDNTDACPESFTNCDASAFPTVWFSFTTGPATSSVDFDNFGSGEQLFVTDACSPTSGSCFTTAPANFVTAPSTTYYVAVNLAGGAEGAISFDIRLNEGPPNENSCNAIDVTGGTGMGSTCCAGAGDWAFTNCPDGDQAANWFVYTPGPTADMIEVTVTNGTLMGNVGVELFTGDCTTMTSLGASNCGGIAGTVVLEASCLDGMDIYIKVGSTSAGCGEFSVDVIETDVACNVSDDCTEITAGEMMFPTTNDGAVCVASCTTGSCDDNCGTNSVWFQVTTDIDASVLSIDVDASFTPSIGVYEGADCGSLTSVVGCTPSPTVLSAVVANFTYWIEVGVAAGEPDDFNICVETLQNVVDCAISASLTPTRPEYPGENPNGPYCPGEKVNFCYDVSFNIDPIGQGNNCQWLQGIIPTFGGGWDIASCPPWPSGPAGATYFPEGAVNYNVNNPILGTIATPHGLGLEFGGSGLSPGTPLPQGWWFTSAGGTGCANDGNPNTMWGLPGPCGGSSQVNFCFDLLVDEILDPTECTDPVEGDMSVDIFTFADGETGCWSSAVCALDVPAIFDGLLDCSSQTMVIAEDSEVCSGDFLNVIFAPEDGTSDVIVETIDNPNISGEFVNATYSGGGGGIIANQVFNNGTQKETFTYQMWALTPGSLCRGPLKEVVVTVYPEITIEFDDPYIVCFDDQLEITPVVEGGDCGPYNYQWDDGSTGPSIFVPQSPGLDPPGIYTTFVTVTDNFGCEGINGFSYEIIQPIIPVISPNPLVLCQDGVFDNGILNADFIDVGTGPYTYQWFPNGLNVSGTSDPTLEIFEELTPGGQYRVDLIVTDSYGCPYFATADVEISAAEELSVLMDFCDYDNFTFTASTLSNQNADLTVCDVNGDLVSGPIFSNAITTNTTMPGIYVVKSVNPSTGCETSVDFEVFPPIDPIIDFDPVGPYCEGDDVTVSIANYNGNFFLVEWFLGSSTAVTGEDITLNNLQSLVQGGVLVYDINGCVTFHDVELEVIPNPEIEIAGSTTFCPGSFTTISVDSLDGYIIEWASPTATSYTTASVDANEEGNWFVTVTEPNGCESVDAVLITQDSELTPQIVGDTLCTGGMVTLNAGGGFDTYQWSDVNGAIAGATNPSLDVTVAGVYTLLVEQGACQGTGTFEVFEFAAPDAPDLAMQNICNADTGNGPDSLNLYTLIDTNLIQGFWLDNNNIPVDSTVYFTGNTPGTIDSFLFITNEARGTCEEDTVLLQVMIEDCSCPMLSIGTPPDFCSETDTFDLNLINFNSDPGSWSILQGGILISTNDEIIIDNNSPAGFYELVYTLDIPGGGNCVNADTTSFTVNSPPVVDITPETSVCNVDVGLGVDFIDLDDLVNVGTGTWSTNSGFTIDAINNIVSFTNGVVGDYIFTFTSNNALSPCSNVNFDVTVTIEDCSCSILELQALPSLCNSGGTINLQDSLVNPDQLIGTWSVNPNMGLSGNIFDATGLPADTYTVTFTNSNPQGGSCIDEVTQTIVVNNAPSAEVVVDSFACNSTTTMTYPTALDLNGLVISGDTNGTWAVSNNYNNGVIPDPSNVDFIGLIPGSYIFTYSLDAIDPCEPVSYTTIINLQNCDCPIIQFNAPPMLCNDDSVLDLNIVLSAVTEPDSGMWNFVTGPTNIDLNGGTIFDASGVPAGEYVFEFVYNNVPLGCEDSREIRITVNEPPNINIIPSASVCNVISAQGPTVIDLTTLVDGAFGTWVAPSNYNGGVLSDPTNVDFEGLPVGDYSFIFTSNLANPPCVDRAYDITITVNDCNCQVVNIDPAMALCNDSGSIDLNTLLNGTAPTEGSWSFVSGPEQISLNGSNFDAQGLSQGSYEFYFTLNTVELGCPDGNGIIVEVNNAPQVNVTPVATVCNTTSIQGPTTLNLNDFVNGDNGIWTVDNGYNNGIIQDITNVDFEGLNIGNSYTFTYTTNTAVDPCSDVFGELVVTVIDCECPNLIVAMPDPVCNDQGSLDLSTLESNGIEPGSWSQSGGPQQLAISNSVIDYSGIAAGEYMFTYTPTVTPPDDCPQSSTISLTVLGIQVLGDPIDQSVCEGEELLISLEDLIPGSTPNGIWLETSAIPSTGNAFDPTSATFVTTGQSSGIYSFTYGFDNSGSPCADLSETIEITIETVPLADAGTDFVKNCSETETVLGGNSSTGADIVYSWIELGGAVIQSPNQATTFANADGTYILTVSNSISNCFDTDTVIISTDPNSLSFLVTGIDSPCFGENAGSITIDDISGANPPVMASIDGGVSFSEVTSGSSFNNLAPGQYDIILEDAIDCRAEQSLIIAEPESWTVDTGDDIQIILGDTYDLSFTPSIDQSLISMISWTANGVEICSGGVDDCLSLSVQPEELTEYCVTAVDFNGCIAEDCQTLRARAIKDLYIPTAFSPNGDGNNDFFWIQTDQEMSLMQVYIYDRWGEEIFVNENADVTDPTTFWDGSFGDQLVQPGVYVYLVKYIFAGDNEDQPVIEAGDVTVLR